MVNRVWHSGRWRLGRHQRFGARLIDLENDVVDYAEFGVLVNGDNDQSASVTLEANSFSDELSEAVDIDVGSTPPVLEKNVAVDARTPGDNIVGYYFVEGSALNFNDLTGNWASGPVRR